MTDRPPVVEEFVRAMGGAGGFVIGTPEHSFGMPGALKKLIDHLSDGWNRKRFGFITAGGVMGGVRAQDQPRQVNSGIPAITIPTGIPVQHVELTWDENGPKADRNDWDSRFDRFFGEFERYARALKAARDATRPAPSYNHAYS